MTDPWRETLWHAFQTFGRLGIAEEMYERAREASASVHWDKLLADKRSDRYAVLELLGALSDGCIESLIKGTLTYDIQHDHELADFVKTSMKPKNAPAIYFMVPASSTGKWLTPTQVSDMIATCRQYLKRAATADDMNNAIDLWPHLSGSDPGRILTTQHMKDSTSAWLTALDKYYCQNVDPTKTDVEWTKVPYEVGFAADTKDRLKQHAINRKTTASFAITQAVLRLPHNPRGGIHGFDYPKTRQYELFPLIEDDDTYAQLGEIVGSLLLSSYSAYGGLNPTLAGTAALKVHMARRDPSIFDRQVITLAKRYKKADFPQNERDRYARLERGMKSLRSLPALEQEAKRKEKEWLAKQEEHRRLLVPLKGILQEVGAARAELATIRRNQQTEINDQLLEIIQPLQELEEAELFRELTGLCQRSSHPEEVSQIQSMTEENVPDHVRAENAKDVQDCQTAGLQKLEAVIASALAKTPPPTNAVSPQPQPTIVSLLPGPDELEPESDSETDESDLDELGEYPGDEHWEDRAEWDEEDLVH